MKFEEQNKLKAIDQTTVSQSIKWLETFWWSNRKSVYSPDYQKDLDQANWETDRLILALTNLKNNP